jgi:dephospho-CoA kinase
MRIAITGGICEGKSTVLGYLREGGWSVCSSDDVARAFFKDPSVNRDLARLAGLDFPMEPGALRSAIGASPSVRRSVNRYLHPLIREATASIEATFFEVPLLFEACLQGAYDEVWVVTCGASEQRRRLVDRYGPGPAIEGLLSSQLPSSAKIAFSDQVIRTNQPPETVRSSLDEATNELSRRMLAVRNVSCYTQPDLPARGSN